MRRAWPRCAGRRPWRWTAPPTCWRPTPTRETLYRVKLADGSAEKVADGLGAVAGLAWDHHGRLFACDGEGGRILVIPQPGDKPVAAAKGFRDAAGLCLDATGKRLLVADRKAGTLTAVAAAVPGAEVDERPLPLETAVAFPDLQWEGWKGETDDGKPNPLRPIVLTHAGDGSNRVFVATEHGVVHVFPNDQKATKTKVFLDLRDRVATTTRRTRRGSSAWLSTRSTRKTASFSSFTRPRRRN